MRARSWELVGAQGALASANEEGEPIGTSGPRQVRVDKVSLDSDEQPAENDGRSRLLASQPALERCAASAQRAGKLVVTFSLQGGQVRDVQVIMDSMRDERIAACVARAVGNAEMAGTGRGTASISVQ